MFVLFNAHTAVSSYAYLPCFDKRMASCLKHICPPSSGLNPHTLNFSH